MKWIVLAVCLLFLMGCSAVPAWETVEDLQPAGVIETWQASSYVLQVGLPEQASLLWENGEEVLYQAGELEITTAKFLSSDLESAVKRLSGYRSEQLNILETTRFDMPEYQFAWFSQTAEGGRLYRADLVMDGMTCYAVVCSAPETSGDFHDQARQVFSSFGLSSPEPV